MLEEKVAADHKKQCNEFKLACDAAVPLDVVMIGAAGAVHKRASSNPGKRAAMNAGEVGPGGTIALHTTDRMIIHSACVAS